MGKLRRARGRKRWETNVKNKRDCEMIGIIEVSYARWNRSVANAREWTVGIQGVRD